MQKTHNIFKITEPYVMLRREGVGTHQTAFEARFCSENVNILTLWMLTSVDFSYLQNRHYYL